jgi:pilus assembly protein CpaB
MAAKRYSLIFYAAIIVALVSTFGVYRVLEATKASARVVTAPVVIAQKDIAEGAGIDRMAVMVAQWPVSTIPAGAFSTVDSVAGRVTRVAIFKGEALVPGRLAPEGTGPGLEVKITPGKRAFSFRINDVSGIAGLIQPNSRVDIVLVMDGGADKGRVAKVFMENMRILAMNAVSQRTDDGRPINAAVATVEVTPSEGEELTIATTQGQIQLMLRGYGDPDSTKTHGATTSRIVQGLSNAPSVPLPPRSEPRRSSVPRQTVPAPAPQPLVLTPPPAPRKPDTNTVTIYRQQNVEKKSFQADSAKKDSTRARP